MPTKKTSDAPADSEDLVMTSLRITRRQQAILKLICEVTGMTKAEIHRQALDNYFASFLTDEWIESEMEKARAKILAQVEALRSTLGGHHG